MSEMFGGNGSTRPPFISPEEVDNLPKWVEVRVTSVKEGETKRGVKFPWIIFQQTNDEWVHRQGFFTPGMLSPLTKAVGLSYVPSSIDTLANELKEQVLWISLGKNKPKGYDRYFVKGVGYSRLNPEDPATQKEIEVVPFG